MHAHGYEREATENTELEKKKWGEERQPQEGGGKRKEKTVREKEKSQEFKTWEMRRCYVTSSLQIIKTRVLQSTIYFASHIAILWFTSR